MMQIIGGIFVCLVLGFGFWQFAYGGGRKDKGRGLGETDAAGGGFSYW